MKCETTYRLENFILGLRWEMIPSEVQERLRGCFADLLGALVTGSQSETFKAGLKLARKLSPPGDVSVIGSSETFSVDGAAAVMGHASNAYDIDDGHNIIRAHPGTSFIGGILAEALEKDLCLTELLTALAASYETTIRSGIAIMNYYQFGHSSGTMGAVGIAAGVGKLRGYTKEQLNNALSVAEFNAPLSPGIVSVEYPSMNKDGVPFGVMLGMLALRASESGFTGNKNLLEAEEYTYLTDDLGEKWRVMELYFKPFPCCRWDHAPIKAVLSLRKEYDLRPEEIASCEIHTFERATRLSKIIPAAADEAQYNIAYPVAAALVRGAYGFAELRKEAFEDPAIHAMMTKLSFHADPECTAAFPQRRLCFAVITTKDGRTFRSALCEPEGEAKDHIGRAWLSEKFCRVTAGHLEPEAQETILREVFEEDPPVRTLVRRINAALL